MIIHMETEDVLLVARKLEQISNDIQQTISALGSSVRNLNWEGGTRDEFVSSFQSLEREIMSEAEEAAVLSLRVSREVDEWLTADGGYRAQTMQSITAISLPASLIMISEEKVDYKWYKIPKAVLKFSKLAITNKKIAEKVPLLGLFLGVGEDVYEGDNFLHATTSESLETLINLTPVGLYGFVLAGGQLISAGFEVAGYHDQAARIQQTVGKTDIVDHLTDAVADFYIHHPTFLLKGNDPVGMVLSPEVQEFAFGFWSQELHTWGLHNQAEWVQNTGNIVVDKMEEWHPVNVFNNYFGFN